MPRWASSRMSRQRGKSALTLAAATLAAFALSGVAGADPGDDNDAFAEFDAPQTLPVISPTPDGWQPMFPFPFDRTRDEVTAAEINAEREMCQWFNAQYDVVKRQIAGLNNAVVRSNGNFDGPGVPEQTAIVVGNLDRSVEFLTPRAQLLTQSRNFAGDVYFPLYQGDSFYGLWQQMSNLAKGIKSRQPTWFTGPSYQRMQHWGSKINRSHVCR